MNLIYNTCVLSTALLPRKVLLVISNFIILMIISIGLYVGCDGIVNGQQYDVCGVCGGDNSTCRLVSGVFTRPFLRPGYNHITDIPEQACNLNILLVKNTSNSFALRFKNGTYFIEGDSIPISSISSTYAAGTPFRYSRNGESQSLVSAGPTSQPLELFLLYRQMNMGLKYEYRVPLKSPNTKKDRILSRHAKHAMDPQRQTDSDIYDDRREPATTTETLPPFNNLNFQYRIKDGDELKPELNAGIKLTYKFKWKVTSFSSCSQTCGEGTKIGKYSCVKENEEDRVVADQKCINQAMKRPDSPVIACSISVCSAEWSIGEWSPCSVICGEGVEKRDLQCARQISVRQKLLVDESECAASSPPNVLHTRACFRKPCNNGTSVQPYWSAGTWSMCSVRCGIGTKTRVIKCVAESEDECSGVTRPPIETSCDMGPCSSQSPAHWLTTEWNLQCPEKCGSGIQTRKITCSADKEEKCSEHPKPESTRQCFSTDRCEPRWFASPWSSCSVECGWGKQSRALVCLMYNTSSKLYSIVTDSNCITEKKLPVEQACFAKKCDRMWYFSEWSSCSMSCDSGIQTRRVRCLDESYASNLNCREEDKPWTKQVCNTEKCQEKNQSIENGLTESTILGHNAKNLNCTNSINNCHLVLRTRLCSYRYYQQRCCQACSRVVVK